MATRKRPRPWPRGWLVPSTSPWRRSGALLVSFLTALATDDEGVQLQFTGVVATWPAEGNSNPTLQFAYTTTVPPSTSTTYWLRLLSPDCHVEAAATSTEDGVLQVANGGQVSAFDGTSGTLTSPLVTVDLGKLQAANGATKGGYWTQSLPDRGTLTVCTRLDMTSTIIGGADDVVVVSETSQYAWNVPMAAGFDVTNIPLDSSTPGPTPVENANTMDLATSFPQIQIPNSWQTTSASNNENNNNNNNNNGAAAEGSAFNAPPPNSNSEEDAATTSLKMRRKQTSAATALTMCILTSWLTGIAASTVMMMTPGWG